MKLIYIKWHYFEALKILESEIQQKQLVQQGRDETPNSESIQPYMYSFFNVLWKENNKLKKKKEKTFRASNGLLKLC